MNTAQEAIGKTDEWKIEGVSSCIFNRHQELDKRVTAAEVGTAPDGRPLAPEPAQERKTSGRKDQLARMLDLAGPPDPAVHNLETEAAGHDSRPLCFYTVTD